MTCELFRSNFFYIHNIWLLAVMPITTTETLICPGWETPVVPVSQPGTPVRDKRGALLSRLVTPTGTKGPLLSRLPDLGQKGTPFLSRTGIPGWETGTTGVSQPGQINVFVVVRVFAKSFAKLLEECFKCICQKSRMPTSFSKLLEMLDTSWCLVAIKLLETPWRIGVAKT